MQGFAALRCASTVENAALRIDDVKFVIDDITPEERRLPYQFMHGPDQYLLVLAGGDHMVFNGQTRFRRAL